MVHSPLSPGPQPSPPDPTLVALLVENHRRFLAFLERRLGDRGMAEEVLQQAFLRALERGGTVRAQESAQAWFFRLLRNAIADHHRRGGKRLRVSGDLDPELEPPAPAPDTAEAVCRCILELAQTLPEEQARALRRVELEGLSLRDFALEAGITANNAAVRVFRAREALRRRLVDTCRTCAEHGCLDCLCSVSEKAVSDPDLPGVP